MSRQAVFGRRSEPHTIIIARGREIRHFTIRPWVAALAGAFFIAIGIGYVLATGYLVLRDDLINATVMRQARMQHAYEDRIAALRAQVDRVTSHRLLDQQFMEQKIAELANRQSALAARSGTLAPLLERAREKGLAPSAGSALPVPALRPGDAADGQAAQAAPSTDPVNTASIAKGPHGALADVSVTLEQIETAQVEQLIELTQAALQQRNRLIETARNAGLALRAKPQDMPAVGGPFVPYDEMTQAEGFVRGLDTLESALDALDKTRREIRSFPIAHPVPGMKVTSGFGKRRDPLLGRTAFHGGIDFATPVGTPIHATAAGTVTFAGRNGGYGNMIEIDHGNGLTTRFAHLNRIRVEKGQKVAAGARIGDAGNTGRSTGPHLHYEVRTTKGAVNPMQYLKAGTRLGSML